MIFLSVTGSFAVAVTYDRRQKKAKQRKWCDLVAHIAQDPLPVNQMPRKITIFLAAPPGDGMRPSREYFKQYIKPVLVAAAMDYDVIEGRKEGDVRYGTAENIRRFRRWKGETGDPEKEKEPDTDFAINLVRENMGIRPEIGTKGDLVIGRHAWKEYLRGLHEGWLGPLDEPTLTIPEPSPIHPPTNAPDHAVPLDGDASLSPDETQKPPEEEPKPAEAEKKPLSPPHAYLSTTAYSASQLSPYIPQVLEPSAPIPHTHLLGFLKTPIRIYNFLNQRHLADDIGRRTAAIVLAASRPYQQSSSFASSSTPSDLDAVPVATRAPENDVYAETVQTSQTWEQQTVLADEEPSWHKSVRKPRTDDLERVWLDDVVLDPRIAERMRRFELNPDEEARAQRIGAGQEKGRAVPMEDLRAIKPKVDDLSHLD